MVQRLIGLIEQRLIGGALGLYGVADAAGNAPFVVVTHRHA